MPKTADNPKPDSAEIDFPAIPNEGTSAPENLAKENLPPLPQRYEESRKHGVQLAKENKAKDKTIEKLEVLLEEAKSKLGDYDDYASFIKSLKDDPKLVEHITSYWKPSEEENLQDLDLTDPKVFQEQVDKKAREIVKTELATFKQTSNRENALERQIQTFLKDHPDKSRKDVDGLIAWSKNNPMTIEHLYMLHNPEEFSKRVAETTRKDITEQQRTVQQTPASLASANSSGKPDSPIEKIFREQQARINSTNLNIAVNESE